MIALVITIIVLLILSGVSINAIVGDNGVLSKATDATYSNACAILEEYFNQLYATMAIDGVDEFETPLHTIMKNGYQNCFFSTSDGLCLKKNYVNEATGENQTLVLYLIKKEQLPEDVRNQLQGGDGLESRDYRKLKGVYGITSDLQAYYCKNGLENMLGLNISDLNADSPDIVFAEADSPLADIINGGSEPVTNQSLKSIKTLTIDTTQKLDVVKDFDKLTNLTTLYFSNLAINDLKGIAGAAAKLNYIKFTNCNVKDYSALNGLTNLTNLYIVRPAGKNEEIARLGSSDKGIANGEFAQLKYFGVIGDDTYLNSSNTNYSGTRYDVTDISPLANFSETTRNAITYMNLQNLQITSISSLSNYPNMYFIRLEENALTDFNGIQNMSKLKYLIAPYQYSNASATTVLGNAEGDAPSDTDALKYIYKNDSNANTELYYVDLRNNNKLKYVDALSSCSGIRYLYLSGCSLVQNASTVGTVIGRCGANYSIDGKYGMEIIADTTSVLSLSGKEMTISEFEQLRGKTSLTHLNLHGISIKYDSGTKLTNSTTPTFNQEVNDVLGTCTNLKYLKLSSLSNLTTIDFINSGKCTKIIELDLYGTSVTDLTNLNTYATSIATLRINNNSINLTTIQPTLNRCYSGGAYWNGSTRGLVLENWNLWKQLENCTNLEYFRYYAGMTSGVTSGKSLDLSNTKLKAFQAVYAWCNIKFPNTVTNLSFDYCATPSFAENCTLLTQFSHCGNRKLSSAAQWKECMESLANIPNLQTVCIENAAYFDFSYLTYLSGLSNLKVFRYAGWDQNQSGYREMEVNKKNCQGISALQQVEEIQLGQMYNFKDLTDIGNCPNLKKFTCYMTDVSDISPLENLTNLEEVTLNDNKIVKIDTLANLTNLKSVNLNNNRIVDIYPLMSCTNMETLYIQNNCLNDVSTHDSRGYEVMDVFYDLNFKKKGSLKKLYISGNNFDDTEILLDLTWDAKSGF